MTCLYHPLQIMCQKALPDLLPRCQSLCLYEENYYYYYYYY